MPSAWHKDAAWENQEVPGMHKEPPHATMMPYPDAASALQGGESIFEQSLNGIWKFYWAPNPEAAPTDFYLPTQLSQGQTAPETAYHRG